MWQGKSPQNTALSSNNQHLLGHGNSTDDIFAFLGVIKLVHIVYLIDVRFVVNKPTNFTAHLSIADLG